MKIRKISTAAILVAALMLVPVVPAAVPQAQAVTVESFLNKTIMTPLRLLYTTFDDIICLGVIRNGQTFAKDKTDAAKTWTIYKFGWLSPFQPVIRIFEGGADIITAGVTEAVYVEPAGKNSKIINLASQNDTGFLLGTIFAPIGYGIWTTGEIAFTAAETTTAFGTGFFVAGQTADQFGLFPKLWVSNYLNSL